MRKVLPSLRLYQSLSKVLQKGIGEEENPLDLMARLGARYMLQVALEEEVKAFLGRAYYQRGERKRQGWRNGYEPGRLKSSLGLLEILIPQVRDIAEPFRSLLMRRFRKGTRALDNLTLRMYVRGNSVRDVEDLLKEVFGERILSKSQVSRIAQRLSKDFELWRKRSLDDLKVVYLFLDATYLPVRQGTREKEGILCAYGITEEGKKVLLHLALGCHESYEVWLDFLRNMKERGLSNPLLVISDKHAGLKKAAEAVFPRSLKQRCLAHKMRNLLSKFPKDIQKEMKKRLQQVLYAQSFNEGLKRGKRLISRFKNQYPSAMECLEEDLTECLNYLKFPKAHQKRIRTTNLLERLFREGKRRTRAVGRFPGENACLNLVYATLITASQRWKGVRMTTSIQRRLRRLQTQILPSLESQRTKALCVA